MIHIGGHKAYVNQLHGLLLGCSASVAVSSSQILPFLTEAAQEIDLAFIGDPAAFEALPEANVALQHSNVNEIAYLQYTSGSTGFPRGVIIKQQTVMANLVGSAHGLDVRAHDRCVSWLPFTMIWG